MDAIKRILHDPVWWFTLLLGSVLIAVLVAPIQKWITDLVYSIVGKSSKKWTERRKRSLAFNEMEIDVFVANPQLIAIKGIRDACSMLYLPTHFLFCFFGVWIELTYQTKLSNLVQSMIGILMGLSTLNAVFIMYSTSKSTIFIYKAYRRYLKRCFEAHKQNQQAVKEFSNEPAVK